MATNLDLAKLIDQMPPTDKELEALKPKPPPAADKPDQPKPKPRSARAGEGSTFTGPDPEVAEKIIRQILDGGHESLVALIGLIRATTDPDFQNYKAEYLLHSIVVYVGGQGKETQRNSVASALASQILNEKLSLGVRGFLVRELGWVGDPSVTLQLGKLLTDPDLGADAVAALTNIGNGAAEQLRAALPKASGKCRLLLVQNLGVLRDERSAESLRQALNDSDQEIRIAAAWGLANLGDANSADLLLKAADRDPGQERIKTTQACLLLAEKLTATGQQDNARKIYTHLRDTRGNKSEKYIRDLAEKALL